MTGDKGTSPTLTAAIRRVLDGDVDAYGTIYDIIDKPLRYYIVKRYGRMDDDFRNEVVTRTHTFVFEHLAQYNPSVASIQTWAKLSSHNVALRVMTERFNLRKVKNADGRWKRVAVSVAMDEEALALAGRTVPGPEEVHDAQWQQHLLWKTYDELASEGKLSMALHDIGRKSVEQTARETGMPVIRVRRLLEKNHHRMRRRLRRAGVSPVEREPHYGRVWQDPDATPYDDDWTCTETAAVPVEPDTRTGADAKSPEEEVVTD